MHTDIRNKVALIASKSFYRPLSLEFVYQEVAYGLRLPLLTLIIFYKLTAEPSVAQSRLHPDRFRAPRLQARSITCSIVALHCPANSFIPYVRRIGSRVLCVLIVSFRVLVREGEGAFSQCYNEQKQ